MTGRTLLVALCAVAFGFVAAALLPDLARTVKHELFPQHAPPSDAGFNRFGQLIEFHDKRELPRPAILPRTIVAFTFGQSNAANMGGEKFRASSDAVLNFWNGRFWRADDPLLGAGGRAGSPWVLMANMLVERGAADQVILIAAAVNDTRAAEWAASGRLNGMLRERLGEARDAELFVTHFLWTQGDSDVSDGTGLDAYRRSVGSVIALTKDYFPQSKFFVARATLCDRLPRSNPEMWRVQTELARLPGVFLGPDTDKIGLDMRYDDCHIAGGAGLRLEAADWVAAILEEKR